MNEEQNIIKEAFKYKREHWGPAQMFSMNYYKIKSLLSPFAKFFFKA